MEQHKFIIASDRDMLGNWTESNIIDVQSLPGHGSGARGIVVQGVGVKPKATKRGSAIQVITEHYTTTPAPPTDQSRGQAEADTLDSRMINTLRPAKTKLGKERIRMKWTVDVNEFILRTYYTITNMETNCKHYRDTLHRIFNEAYPDVEVCAQRIADQRRAIVKNHLLPQERIEQIRQEVEQELQGSAEIAAMRTTTAAATTNSLSTGALVTSSPASKISTTPTTWYAYMKEHDPLSDTDNFNSGPSSHKLRKVDHKGDSGGLVATTTATPTNVVISTAPLQQQPHHNIIIHTTSLGGPHSSIGQLRR